MSYESRERADGTHPLLETAKPSEGGDAKPVPQSPLGVDGSNGRRRESDCERKSQREFPLTDIEILGLVAHRDLRGELHEEACHEGK